MRTAICLCGIVGGKEGRDGAGGNIPFEECYNHYKQHIIDINNADVFIHSWSCDVKDEINQLYKPVLSKFEEQIKFEPKFAKSEKKRESEYRSLSRWYSVQEVIKLKQQHEKENGFEYDCVMLTRFDTLFFVDLDFSKYELKKLNVSHWNTPAGLPGRPEIKPDKCNRSLDRDGFLDLWFFSNSNLMDEFSKIYKGIDKGKYSFSQHKAPWDHLIKRGYSRDDFKYTLYRHYDFELYRWHQGFYQKMRKEF